MWNENLKNQVSAWSPSEWFSLGLTFLEGFSVCGNTGRGPRTPTFFVFPFILEAPRSSLSLREVVDPSCSMTFVKRMALSQLKNYTSVQTSAAQRGMSGRGPVATPSRNPVVGSREVSSHLTRTDL